MKQQSRISYIASSVAILSLLALLIIPVATERKSRALRESISVTAEPARRDVSQIQLSLAAEVSSLRGYVITGHDVMLKEYREARREREERFARLSQRLPILNAAVRLAAPQARLTVERWSRDVERLVQGLLSKEEFIRGLLEQQQLYRAALDAMANLDQAIAAFQQEKRLAIQRLERQGRWLLAGLTVLASTSAGLILYLGRRLRGFSTAASTDVLTGLLNRRGFLYTAQRALDSLGPGDGPSTVMYIDVDDFKAVNDSRGHAVGDDLLRAVAVGIRKAVRSTDLPARFGGDEFVILLSHHSEGTPPQEAVERIVHQVQGSLGSAGWSVGISTGAVTAWGERDLTTLMHAADKTMFEMKRAGKGAILWRPMDSPH